MADNERSVCEEGVDPRPPCPVKGDGAYPIGVCLRIGLLSPAEDEDVGDDLGARLVDERFAGKAAGSHELGALGKGSAEPLGLTARMLSEMNQS